MICSVFPWRRVEELCHPSPCGQNTKCEVINTTPTCSCLSGYVGNPLSGCRHECESDGECGSQEMCKDFKCQSSCSQCGTGAQCVRVANHRAICECPKVCCSQSQRTQSIISKLLISIEYCRIIWEVHTLNAVPNVMATATVRPVVQPATMASAKIHVTEPVVLVPIVIFVA